MRIRSELISTDQQEYGSTAHSKYSGPADKQSQNSSWYSPSSPHSKPSLIKKPEATIRALEGTSGAEAVEGSTKPHNYSITI